MKYITVGAFIFCTLSFNAYSQNKAITGEPIMHLKHEAGGTIHLSRIFVANWQSKGKEGTEVISLTKPAMAIRTTGSFFSPDKFTLLEPGDSLYIHKEVRGTEDMVLQKTTGELITSYAAVLVGCDSKPPSADVCHTFAQPGAVIERIDINSGHTETLATSNSRNMVYLLNNNRIERTRDMRPQHATVKVITADEYASLVREADQLRQREVEEQKAREARRVVAAREAEASRLRKYPTAKSTPQWRDALSA